MADLIQGAALLLQKDFELPEEILHASQEELEAKLHVIVQQLLNRDFERLLQICYRIDLGEQKLKHILYETPPEEMSLQLTKALIERQKIKVEMRRRYAP
jgi:hypothetical protein